MRAYDERQERLVKFQVTLSSITGTIMLSLLKLQLFEGNMIFFLKLFFVVSIISFVCGLVIFGAMVQNRLYFVYSARQINAIRKYLLRKEASDFKDNQMYLSKDFSAFKLFSIQTFMLLGVSFVSSTFLAFGLYSRCLLVNKPLPLWGLSLLIIVAMFVQMLFAATYLLIQGSKHADKAIHGK